MWGQKAPSKHENGGKKRPQNHKVGAESAPAQIRAEKSVGAKSAVKMQKWGRKAPSKQQSDGKKRHHSNQSEKSHGGGKCHQNNKVMAKSATTLQLWWNFNHHISNRGGTLTTTYHIQGAGAPAKTENYVNADAFIFFREKVRPFPHLAKPVNTILRKDEKAMVQIKRDWFDTALKNYERGEMYGRWKEKIQV